MEPLLTSDEIAGILKVDVVTIRRLVNRGGLAAYRVGSEFRFAQEDLKEFLQRQRVSGLEFEMELSGPGVISQVVQQAGRWLKKSIGEESTDHLDRFSEEARHALQYAHEEAQNLHHTYIGTEHFLLGLIYGEDNRVTTILKRLDIERKQVYNSVLYRITRGRNNNITDDLPLTPRAKKVLELAVGEAQRLGYHRIEGEHILLGIIREGDGIGARVLQGLSIQAESVRREILKLLQEDIQETLPPIPVEATSLLSDDAQGTTCPRCQARCPNYFRYCFHCGKELKPENM